MNSEYFNVDQLHGEIYYNDSENESIKIGKVELHYYNDNFIKDGFRLNLFDTFDRSMDTVRLGYAILDSDTGEIKFEIEDRIGLSYHSNILVIHDLMLFKEFRSKGYGKKIISGIETFFCGRCGYIALQSFPKQHDLSIKEKNEFQEYDLGSLNTDYESAQVSLDEFYTKCGFHKIEGEEESFFIKNLDPM